MLPDAVLSRTGSCPARCVSNDRLVLEEYVRVAVNAIISGCVRIGEGAVIAPGAIVTKHVPPYPVASGAAAKPIGPVSNKIVVHERLVKGDFGTGTSVEKLPSVGWGKAGGADAEEEGCPDRMPV